MWRHMPIHSLYKRDNTLAFSSGAEKDPLSVIFCHSSTCWIDFNRPSVVHTQFLSHFLFFRLNFSLLPQIWLNHSTDFRKCNRVNHMLNNKKNSSSGIRRIRIKQAPPLFSQALIVSRKNRSFFMILLKGEKNNGRITAIFITAFYPAVTIANK